MERSRHRGRTEPRETWDGAAGGEQDGGESWLLEFMVFMTNITEEK